MPSFMHPLDGMPLQRRLYIQVSAWSFGLFLISSLNISDASYEEINYDFSYDELAVNESQEFVTDEEGYVIKSIPLEGETLFDQNRTEKTDHEVQPGETLSVIAYRYGLKSSTIKYANPTIGSGDYLKIGQKLSIPPKDGYYVKVKSGDSLAKLAEKYKGNLDKTKEFNGITQDSELIADTELLIVDGKPEVIYIATNNGGSRAYASSAVPTILQYNIPANSQGWILPTRGRVNQVYHSGHYAFDVGDRSQPPILAADGGVIAKANSGCAPGYSWCGGGYGNHIVIDHGNGYFTLYAHMEAIYVEEGDTVQQGQVIGKMGRSGRVRGATGIHLHFEVSYNGQKLNPATLGKEFNVGVGGSW